jgi:hypothetical protein
MNVLIYLCFLIYTWLLEKIAKVNFKKIKTINNGFEIKTAVKTTFNNGFINKSMLNAPFSNGFHFKTVVKGKF